MEVCLQDILDAREARVRLQQQFLETYRCPLVCFTMNIAGPVKTSPLIQRGFQYGMDALAEQIPLDSVQKQLVQSSATGDTAIYAVKMDAKKLKAICTAIEESSPLGRLFDMDVIDVDGAKLERQTQRGCIVCGTPGRGCASKRLHSVDQLQKTTNRILTEHFAKVDAQRIASKAVQCLIDEVNTTPKPGLVDRRNNGSHKDMTIDHFLASAQALKPYFTQCVQIGQENSTIAPSEIFPLLRQAGLQAEKAMYAATGGVNTHKGAIYTLGVLCGSIGRLWTAQVPVADTSDILKESAKVVKAAAEADLQSATGSTSGEKIYLQYGIGGIRSEVAKGLPSVANIALPYFTKALQNGLTRNDAGCNALLHLIANVDDTNLYHRGGKDGAVWAATAAKRILPKPTVEEIYDLDAAFIRRNLSPGGCADLLAVTIFLSQLLHFPE